MRLPLVLAVLLIAFLVLGAFAERRMRDTARELGAVLREVKGAITRQEKEKALTGLRLFESRWEKAEKTWALVTDHHEMDQVHLAIDRADEYLSAGRLPEAAAEIASLSFLVEHIPRKETLGLRSVF